MNTTYPNYAAIKQSSVHPSYWIVTDLRWYKGGTHITDDYGNLVRLGWPQFAVYCNSQH